MTRRKRTRTMLVAVALSLGTISGCSSSGSPATKEPPASVVAVEGSDLKQLTLTQKAADRLGVETAIIDAPGDVVPYGAVLYDPKGGTWLYTSPESLTFVRAPIVVERIEGDRVLLSDGPPAGTAVVTVGAAKLFGLETGVGK